MKLHLQEKKRPMLRKCDVVIAEIWADMRLCVSQPNKLFKSGFCFARF